jgi:DNA repair protein RadC
MFASALKIGATGLIIAHNHPSGQLTPSAQDIEITKDIVKGGDILRIKVLDHLIITADGYYSMADNGDM